MSNPARTTPMTEECTGARSAEMTESALSDRIRAARLRLLRMHYESRVGHIGGNLSSIDILMTLFHTVLRPQDRFLLSKGHSAGALYVTLASMGRIPDEELASFHKSPTRLAGHPAPNKHGDIVFATGSLGHGLPLANGLALARVLRGAPGRVYCLLSDGECQEGSTWEAIVFGAHRDLPITAIIDMNGLQGFGSTRDVAGMHDLPERVAAFGRAVVQIDGHSTAQIRAACAEATGFTVIAARTSKGRGVSFMEDRMEWHYLPLTETLYAEAVRQVDGGAS
ncbi:MAG: transketolase [Capsulimonadaceae bacterium]